MKKKFTATALLTLVFLAGTLFVSAQSKANTASKTTGLLYKITGKGIKKPSYIFGTVHIICPDDMVSMKKLTSYLNLTQRIFMELDLDDPNLTKSMAASMAFKDGKTIKDYLSPEEYAKVDELFKNTMGIPLEALAGFRPFALSSMLTTSPKTLGCPKPSSYDLSLSQDAVSKKKPVLGLESIEDQMAAIESTPVEKQAKALYEVALNPEKTAKQLKELIEVYKLQDSDAVYSHVQKASAEGNLNQENLLDKRNIAWIPIIEKAVKESPTFIAVGAAHLGGKNGVIELLKAKGFKFQAIRL